MADIYSTSFPLNETICKNCVHRMSKVITPIDPEDFGFTDEEIEELESHGDEEIQIEQHTCLITQQDMDYIVKDCNHFMEAEGQSFFITNPYE